MSIPIESKARAVAAFIKIMYNAGCSADELKQLLKPGIIDAVIEKVRNEQHPSNTETE